MFLNIQLSISLSLST